MSEVIFRLLLHLYPSRFRQEYGDEALQLFRDRTRDETGVWPRVRLWFDLLNDLAISLPREYCYRRAQVAGASAQASLDSTPTFFVFDTLSPGRRPLLLGGLLSLITLASFPKLMNEFGNFRPPTGWTFASPGAHERQSGELQRQASQSEQSAGQAQPGTSPTLDAAARHRIIENAVASIKQHHLDHIEAQEAADALLAHERRGDDGAAASTEEFARLATRQMREATGSNKMVLLYTTNDIPERTPGPEPLPAAYRDEMQRLNCTFERVEMLPHNVGYLKLNAFPYTSVCRAKAAAAMTKLNDADALIFDLRDNRGGFPSMVSLLAAYLFDHPEYIYCPLENTTAESWTRSPVPRNKLAAKPVYILTSSRTISAAEQFTYDLKMLKRATLVGETTAGGGHAANLHSVGDDFYVGTIEVRAINPYAKRDWNDTGIDPDFKVRAPDALNAALRLVDKKLHGE